MTAAVRTALTRAIPRRWEDPAQTGAGLLPAHAWFLGYDTAQAAAAGQRAMAQGFVSLSGRCRVRRYDSPARVITADVCERAVEPGGDLRPGWSTATVPDAWPRPWPADGFPLPVDVPHVPSHNPTAVYQFDADLAPVAAGARRILRIESAGAYVEVHVNGVEVGWAKGARRAVELDVSDAARDGRNLVALTVVQFADSTYLEGPCGWWAAGVLGAVTVHTQPTTRLDDYVLRTTMLDDGAARLTVGLCTSADVFEGPARVTWTVRSAPGGAAPTADAVLAAGVVAAATGVNDIDVRLAEVAWWSPEAPALYLMELTVHRADGTPTQHVALRFGFRDVALRDGVLHLNGRPFPLRAAPRVDDADRRPDSPHRPDSPTALREHLERLKRGHVSVVPADDYPAGPRLYELCDELGLLVVAGLAPIVPAGAATLAGITELADDAAWRRAFVDRLERQVTADRNHPSVIAWSVGGRPGDGCNLAAAYWACVDLDPTRPAIAPGALGAGVPADCPVTVSPVPGGLRVRNGWVFTSLDGVDLVVDDLVDGVVRASRTVAPGVVAPQASAVVTVPPPAPADGEVLRTVHVLRRAATPWSPAHAVLGSYQWRVPASTPGRAPESTPRLPRGHVAVSRTDQECTVRAASSTWAFDTVTGRLVRWSGAGRELVVRGPRVHHLAAMTESARVVDVEHDDDDAAHVQTRTILAPPGRDFGLQVVYGWDLFDDGAARLTVTGEPFGTCDEPVTRVGLDLGVPGDLDRIEYYGRPPGAHTSWIARRTATTGPTTYERVRWVLHQDRDGRALLLAADRRSLAWSTRTAEGGLAVSVEHRTPGSHHTRFGPFCFSLLLAPLDAGDLDPGLAARALRASHATAAANGREHDKTPGMVSRGSRSLVRHQGLEPRTR